MLSISSAQFENLLDSNECDVIDTKRSRLAYYGAPSAMKTINMMCTRNGRTHVGFGAEWIFMDGGGRRSGNEMGKSRKPTGNIRINEMKWYP